MAASLISILKQSKQPGFFPNHYEVLGLSNFSAYNPKKKLQRLQEVKNEILDLNTQTKLIRLINQADKTLRDRNLRLKYNQELEAHLRPKEKTSQPKERRIPPKKKRPEQKAKTKKANTYNDGAIQNSTVVLGVLHSIIALAILGLNVHFFSWHYIAFIVFSSFMVFALLKAIANQGFSVIIEEEENWVLFLIGFTYYMYNKELLILAVLCILAVVLIKESGVGRYRVMPVIAPVICSILFLFSVYAYHPLRQQYFSGGFKILETSFKVKAPEAVKTFAHVYTHCNIRAEPHPNGERLAIASPNDIYEVIDTASRKDWYEVVLEDKTGFIHLNSSKGNIYKDTITVVFER